jgi:hypothetical protein
MQEILDEIERTADRCKVASSSVKESFLRVLGAADPAEEIAALLVRLVESKYAAKDFDRLDRRARTEAIQIEKPAREAIQVFDHVRERILPRLDAVLKSEKDFTVLLKQSSVRGRVSRDHSLEIKAKMLEMVTKQTQAGGQNLDLRVLVVVNSLSEVLYGSILAIVTLPDLGEDLAYIAGYLKAKIATAPQPPETGKVHVGDLVVGAKYTSTITGSTVGAVAQGDHAPTLGTVTTQQGPQHYHGETHMGDKYNVTTTNSTIGAQAIGKNAHAVGTVNMSTPGTLTQEQHKAAITQAQNALNEDQDALERLDNRLYEALGQFLRMARQIQVEQQSLAQVQVKMKETLDDVWVQQVAKGLRPQALPEGLKVIEALAKSPITVEVAKKLLAGG